MLKNIYFRLLIAELAVILAVTTVFKLIHERVFAGAVAGTIFVLLGLWIFFRGWRDRSFRFSPTFWSGCAHLFLSALPLMITRLLNAGAGFEDVRVLGLPGPVFHRVSTGIYFLLLLATLFDLIRTRRSVRLAENK